jgi:sporulation protein YlmC with PRC-barrel domain
MESTSKLQEITALIEHEVYSASGTFVGQVEDLKLDLDAEAVTGLALGRVNDEMFEEYAADERGIIVPYRWVRSVGDIIIVNDTIERFDESESDESVVE